MMEKQDQFGPELFMNANVAGIDFILWVCACVFMAKCAPGDTHSIVAGTTTEVFECNSIISVQDAVMNL